MRRIAVLCAQLALGCSTSGPTPSPERATGGQPEAPVAVDPPPPTLPRGPIHSDGAAKGHAAAQAKFVRKGPPLAPLVPADEAVPQGPPGGFVPIAGKAGAPGTLTAFHEALRGLAGGGTEKVRVLMYGASGTASDRATGYIRTYLQARFGDGGPGFVPLVPLGRWYHHSEVEVTASRGWTKEHAQISKARPDGRWGLLGASFYASKRGRWTKVVPRSDRVALFDLSYLAQPSGGSFEVTVDGKGHGVVSTAADAPAVGGHRIEVEPGRHTLQIRTRGDGEVRVFGVVVENDAPGVVLDTLGINGTRLANHTLWDEAMWAAQAKARQPALYTLSYGTNESVDEDEDIAIYRRDLVAMLRRFRTTLPDASCVLLVPGDFPIVTADGPTERLRLTEIIAIQREVGPKHGCGIWDGLKFMGGPGSMVRWVQADPPLARDDYLHFNGRGAARKGMALSDALMLEYDAPAR